MNELGTLKGSSAWNLYSYLNFIVAAGMMAGGIYFLEASFSAKGFYAMAALMLVNATASISKTLRDTEESQRLHHKIDEARTERLLMEVATPRT